MNNGSLYCPNCNSEIKKNDSFCSNCGIKLENFIDEASENRNELKELDKSNLKQKKAPWPYLIIFLSLIGVLLAVSFYLQKNPIISTNTKDEASIYYDKGNEYFEKEDYDYAIIEYTKAINKNRKMFEAYIQRGKCCIKTKDEDKAIDDFDMAIQINEKYSYAYYLKGLSLFGKWVNTSNCSPLANIEMEYNLTKAIELNPEYADAYFLRATYYDCRYGIIKDKENLHYARRDYSKAINFGNPYAQDRLDKLNASVK